MGQENPLLLLALIAGGVLLARAWWVDLRDHRQGRPNPQAFPGATPAAPGVMVAAVCGTVLLLAAETYGEIRLGLSAQQSKTTILFGLYTLAAAAIEEVIFRGYLVIENRGRGVLLAGVVAASAGFALLHPFLWQWHDAGFVLQLTAKGWFSTLAIFTGSLWFYALRLLAWNPQRSLLPCFAAHATKNLGVFLIKLAQGHVTGAW